MTDRVIANPCRDCNSNPSFIIDGDVISINNICCEKYSRIIGNSLSIRNINDYAIKFRGEFLNTFCLLENFVDVIIELAYSQFELDFKNQYSNGILDNLTMRDKKNLFHICLKKYQELTQINIGKIWGHFSNVIEKRNHLAHWAVDTSIDGLKYLERNQIRFVNFDRFKIIEEDVFNSKKSALLVKKIKNLTVEVIKVYKFFLSNSK